MFVLLVALSPVSLGIPLWCLCCWWRCHLCRWLFVTSSRSAWLVSPTATPSLSLAALKVSVGCGRSEAAERVSPPRMWSVVDRGCGLLRLSLFVCVLSSVVWGRGVGLLSSSWSRSTLVLSLCGLEVLESSTSFFGIPVTASSSLPSRAAVMLLDAVPGGRVAA